MIDSRSERRPFAPLSFRHFRPVLSTIAVLLPLLLLSGSHAVADEKPQASSRPNIVMIISDDQTWTDYGFMNHPVIRTPHLDRLAADSATFTRGYVPTSLCRPSLMTMITGLYPHQHRIVGNDPPKGTDRRSMEKHVRNLPTLPKWLAERGYRSHQSGKWWEGAPANGGFTAGMTHGDPSRGGRHGDVGLRIGRAGMKPVFDFIDDCAKENDPFFLWYAPFLPHTPHNPPEEFLKKYRQPGRPIQLAKYYAMCEWFDLTCGQLLGHLEERGLGENTLVVYVTDNGWIQRTPKTDVPEGWRFGFAPKSKRSPYDGGLRTPIMFRWPGVIEPHRNDSLISSIDLVPTVLAAVDIDVPESLPGLNLLPVLKSQEQTKRSRLYGEIFTHDEVDIDDPDQSLLYRWVIDGRMKLIQPHDPKLPAELYDLQADPLEENDLADDRKQEVERLRKLLDTWYDPAPYTPRAAT